MLDYILFLSETEGADPYYFGLLVFLVEKSQVVFNKIFRFVGLKLLLRDLH
jgi:hypothetical protein